MLQLMQACDAIAHTSVTPEPFGRVIVEAMFSRRPVIATAAGGAIELIEPDKTGWLTEPGNAEDLTKAIHSIQQDAVVSESIVQAAYSQAFDRFHIDSTNRQIAMILNTILNTIESTL
jgi:glycosyltransferase involved in cell wall biosynthesis